MAVTKTVSYSGTVQAFQMLLRHMVEKELETIHDPETGQWEQQETGAVIATFVFDVAGEEYPVRFTIPAGQLSSKTYLEALNTAANTLETELGL